MALTRRPPDVQRDLRDLLRTRKRPSPSGAAHFVSEQLSLRDAILSLAPSHYLTLGATDGLVDQSGNGRDGTANGGLTIGGGASITADGEASTDFPDDSTKNVTSGYSPFAQDSQRTFIGWANRDTSGSVDSLIASDRGSGLDLSLQSGGLGTVGFYLDGGVSPFQSWINVWPGVARSAMFALTIDTVGSDATVEVIIDGTSRGRVVLAAEDFHSPSPGNFMVGGRSGVASPFDGRIAHVAVFEKLLSIESLKWLAALGAGHAAGRDFGLISQLPSPALPGDCCSFIAGSTNGVIWELVYDGQGSYPWKYIGGPELTIYDTDLRTLTNQTTYADLPTDPQSLTLPALAGDYDIRCECDIDTDAAGNFGFYSYAVGATAAADEWGVAHALGSSAGTLRPLGRSFRHFGVAASAVIAEKGRTGGNYSIDFDNRRISVKPVQVG